MSKIPVTKAKVRFRDGDKHRIVILSQEFKQFPYLTLYRDKICLEVVVWKNAVGLKGNGKRKLRFRPENYGLASSTGLFDKDIVSFRRDGRKRFGLVTFSIEDVLADRKPWHVVTSGGEIFDLDEMGALYVVGSLLEGDQLEDFVDEERAVLPVEPVEPETEDIVWFESPSLSPSDSAPEPFLEEPGGSDEIEERPVDKESSEREIETNEETGSQPIENVSAGEQLQLAVGAEETVPAGKETPSGPHLVFYTDGSAITNPGPCGGAYVMLMGGVVMGEKKIPLGDGTNNIAEMQAVISAMEDAASFSPSKVTIRSDSQYVIKGITQWSENWKKNGWIGSSGSEVANVELWQRMSALKETLPVEFEWVKGHAEDEYNERADALAAEAAREKPLMSA